MSYPAYPSYKDSGIEWLGEIPTTWEAKRLKFATILRNDKVEAKLADLPYLGLENIESATGRLKNTASPIDAEGIANSYFTNDVLFGKLRPYLAKVYKCDHDGICTSELLVLKTKGVLPSFLKYFILADQFIKIVNSSTYGAKMPRASWEFIGNITCLLPPPDDQAVITDFLDYEIAKIDTLIAKQHQLIETLQEKRQALISHIVTKGLNPNALMKDSGIEWLGDIPSHWEKIKLKREISFITSGSRGWAEHYVDDGDIFIRIGNLTRDSIKLDLSDIQFVAAPKGPESERTKVRPDDLLISITAYLGLVAVVPSKLPPTYINQHVALVRPTGYRALPRWLGYQILSTVGQTQLALQGYGGTKIQLTLDDIATLTILIPPKDEQQDMINRIERNISDIESLIKKTTKSLQLLQERRTSLISAAVTGKIDVRAYGNHEP